MRRLFALAILLLGLYTACASSPVRYAGHYNRTEHIYRNTTVGFRLRLPQHWAVTTKRRDFTVPLDLRPDQEQVLEAYDPNAKLGLVIVIQQGPVVEVAKLVQRMQEVPPAQRRRQLQSPQATDVRQIRIRKIEVNGYEAAEWVYTATDTTARPPVNITVSSYILKVSDHYVYLTFSVPASQTEAAGPAIQAILHTFGRPADT